MRGGESIKISYILPVCIERFLSDLANPNRDQILATRRQGFENQIASVVEHLGHDVCLYYMTNLYKKERKLLHKDGYQINLIPASFHPFRLQYPYELSIPLLISVNREIANGNIDVIHVYDYYSAMFPALSILCRIHKIPLVAHYQGGKVIGKGCLKLFFGLVAILSLQFASKILVVNGAEKTKLINAFKVSRDKIVLCPNGVNVDVFRPMPQKLARSILGLSSKKKYVLFVGRLSDFHKGVSYLLKAFKKIKQKIKNVSLLIIGSGPDEQKLRSISKSLRIDKDTHFVGSIVNEKLIVLYYNSSDIVVVPSLFEAFGIVNIEAMSCAKPVVASRVGGIKDIITDKETGFLVSPRNSKELEERVVSLLTADELRKRIGFAARKKCEQSYSLASLGAKLDKIYRELF